jgi:hypothetical protein
MHISGDTGNRGQLLYGLGQLRAHAIDVNAGRAEQMPYRTALLIQHGGHHMHRFDVLMIMPNGQALGVGQHFLKLACEFIHPHGSNLSKY